MSEVTNLYSGLYGAGAGRIAFTVNEKRTDSYSEGSSGQTITMNYALQASKAIDLDTARDMVADFVSNESLSTREGLPLSSFSLEHDNEEDLDLYWSFSLEWSAPSSDSGGSSGGIYHVPYDEDESWSTEGGTAHITDAVWKDNGNGSYVCGESVVQIDSNDSGPDTFNGRIGWNGETAEGVDVVRPAFSFSLKKKVTAAVLDTAVPGSGAYFGMQNDLTYRQIIAALTGSVNASEFRGWSAGNVLFEGASSSTSVEYDDGQAQTDPVTGRIFVNPTVIHNITFKFKCMFGSTLHYGGQSIHKEGFQYLWIYSRKLDDSATGVTIEYPQTVVVNDVYHKANFALLGF